MMKTRCEHNTHFYRIYLIANALLLNGIFAYLQEIVVYTVVLAEHISFSLAMWMMAHIVNAAAGHASTAYATTCPITSLERNHLWY